MVNVYIPTSSLVMPEANRVLTVRVLPASDNVNHDGAMIVEPAFDRV